MTYQNRVDPWGHLVRTPERGTLLGNRGNLHGRGVEILRQYQTKRWIICLLEFKGRHRQVMTPGQYTELFFLDEATGFAAGHRPCAECQRERFEEFKLAWLAANPGVGDAQVRVEVIDEVLHRERYARGEKVTYRARWEELPSGAFFSLEGQAYLVNAGEVYRWSFGGYSRVDGASFSEEVDVLTPRSVVRAFELGFVPRVHPSGMVSAGN